MLFNRYTARAGIALILLLFAAGAEAQYYNPFGRNKVQYKNFEWQILTTQHFEVYYYPTEEETAIDAAKMAERAYTRLNRILRHRMTDRIPLVLYASHSDFQQTNITPGLIGEGTGGVTEFFKGRVFLPFTGSYAELEHVLEHELVHAFQVDIIFGKNPGASLLNPMAFQPPLWFMEGMAEYLSVGTVDEHTRMWLRDAALQGYLVPISTLNFVSDLRVYRFGQSIFEFIGNRYGDEKIGEILRKAPRLRSLEEAMKSAIGKNLQELSDIWMEAVRKTYLPQIAQYKKPKDFARQLTHHGEDLSFMNVAPAISPKGDKMVFISDRSMYQDIYLASAIDGRIIAKLVKGERSGDFESLRFLNTSISWSPDEKYIAFPAKIGPEDALYIMDVRKQKVVHRLAFGLDGLHSPSWSPDGQRLVFVGLAGGQSDLYVTDLTGTNWRPLTQDRYADREPHWSPDGKKIVLTTDRGPETDFSRLVYGDFRIALYDLETGTITVLPNQRGKNISPQWSPDGKKIAFVSDRSGISNIYITDLETMGTYQITNILTGVTGIVPSSPAISWSQKGNRLLFSAFSNAGLDIYAINDPLRLMKEPSVTAAGGPVSRAVSAQGTLARDSSSNPEATAQAEGVTGDTVAQGKDPAEAIVAAVTAQVLQDVPQSPEATESSTPLSETARRKGYTADDLPSEEAFKSGKYKPKFTLDYIAGAAGFASNIGVVGTTFLSFSDILGNHNLLIGADVFGSLSDADLLVVYTNLTHRTNYGIALFQLRTGLDTFAGFVPYGFVILSQVNRGLSVSLSRPFNTFSRLDGGLELTNRSRNRIQVTNSFFGPRRDKLESLDNVNFMTPSVGLVTDNVLYGSTGPIAGTRARLNVAQTVGGLRYISLLADYRTYLNIRQHYSFAVRALGMVNHGRDQDLLPFGGPFSHRGLDFWDVWGSKMGLVNLEFRFPLVEILQLGWPLPLGFRGVRGVLFMDIGGVWDQRTSEIQFSQYEGYPNVGTRLINGRIADGRTMEDITGGSPVAYAYGFGARIRAGFLIFKLDIAQLTNFSRSIGDTKVFLTIGADF